MVSSQRTVATIRPTYHKRQKSGALAAIIRRNGELLTRSFPPGDGLPRYVCTIGNQQGRTGLLHQIMGVMSICLDGFTRRACCPCHLAPAAVSAQTDLQAASLATRTVGLGTGGQRTRQERTARRI